MHVPTYEQVAFAWRPDAREERRFRLFLTLFITVFLLAGIVLSSIPLPKKERMARVEVPERVAKFITERPKPKPVEVKPEQKPPPPRPEPKFERKPKEERKPLTKIEKKAREKAEDSGLLALTKGLSDLIDTASAQAMTSGHLSKSGDSQSVAAVNTDILTKPGAQGSGGGVKQEVHDGDVGHSRLDAGQRQVAQKLLASKGEIGSANGENGGSGRQHAERGDNLRSEADVAYVMDKYKSILHAIYHPTVRTGL